MATTYSIKIKPPVADWWDEAGGSHHLPRTVHEVERSPIDTGIVDVHGNRILRFDQPEPIGFVHFKRVS